MRAEFFEDAKAVKFSATLETRIAKLRELMALVEDKTLLAELRLVETKISRRGRGGNARNTPEARQRAYDKRLQKQRETEKTATARKQRWTDAEDAAVMTSTLGDKELAISIGRTMAAVCGRRSALRKAMSHNVRGKPPQVGLGE